MKTVLCAMVLPLALACVHSVSAQASEPPTPLVLLRIVERLQDRMVHGSAEARLLQRRVLVEAAAYAPNWPVTIWQDRREAEAVAALILVGIDRAVAADLVAKAPDGDGRMIAQQALAAADGQSDDATPHVASTTLAALFALTLAAHSETAQAHLDRVRLLATGTLAEEAALRRQSLSHLRPGHLSEFARVLGEYLRRYKASIYRKEYLELVMQGLLDLSGDPAFTSAPVELFDALDDDSRDRLAFAVSRRALEHGDVALAAMAMERITAPTTRDGARARAHKAAARLLVEEVPNVACDLLDNDDCSLLRAAHRMSTWLSSPFVEASADGVDKIDSAALRQAAGSLNASATLLAGRAR